MLKINEFHSFVSLVYKLKFHNQKFHIIRNKNNVDLNICKFILVWQIHSYSSCNVLRTRYVISYAAWVGEAIINSNLPWDSATYPWFQVRRFRDKYHVENEIYYRHRLNDVLLHLHMINSSFKIFISNMENKCILNIRGNIIKCIYEST